MVCDGLGRIPWPGFRTVRDPVAPLLLRVSGCGCRPVCAACYAAVGGLLEQAPCLLCGLSCGLPGCSPLVVPGQPFAPGEPFGCPQLQWLRSLESLSCSAAVHRYANVAPGVVGGFGAWPARRLPVPSSSEGESSESESAASSESESVASGESETSAEGGLASSVGSGE